MPRGKGCICHIGSGPQKSRQQDEMQEIYGGRQKGRDLEEAGRVVCLHSRSTSCDRTPEGRQEVCPEALRLQCGSETASVGLNGEFWHQGGLPGDPYLVSVGLSSSSRWLMGRRASV